MTRPGFSRTAALFAAPVLLLSLSMRGRAADKDVVELQREVASITDQINSLQSALNALQMSINEKLASQSALLQQTLDRVNQIHTDQAVSNNGVASQLRDQEQKVAQPVAALNAKIDQVVTQSSAAQESLADVSARLGRLEQRLTDLENAVKVIQSGPAQPPAASAPTAQGGPPAGITAEGLYANASRDQLSGKSDLALQEYHDYIEYYGSTEMAAGAQFHIGEIQLNQGNLDDAIQAFDAVMERYPDSPRAADALYLKAQALEKQGKRTLAFQALNDTVRKYPDSDAARSAKNELARLRPRPRRTAN